MLLWWKDKPSTHWKLLSDWSVYFWYLWYDWTVKGEWKVIFYFLRWMFKKQLILIRLLEISSSDLRNKLFILVYCFQFKNPILVSSEKYSLLPPFKIVIKKSPKMKIVKKNEGIYGKLLTISQQLFH